MSKKTLIASAAFLMLAVGASAFAATSTVSTSTNTGGTSPVAAKIACVGAAVNTREQAIDAAMTAFTVSSNAAYAARATALQQAYTNTTLAAVRAAVKVAWSDFNTSMKAARKTWLAARNDAWSAYGKAAAACKAPGGTGDGAHISSEASGN